MEVRHGGLLAGAAAGAVSVFVGSAGAAGVSTGFAGSAGLASVFFSPFFLKMDLNLAFKLFSASGAEDRSWSARATSLS